MGLGRVLKVQRRGLVGGRRSRASWDWAEPAETKRVPRVGSYCFYREREKEKHCYIEIG